MMLTGFIQSLASDGAVTVAGEITRFDQPDYESATRLLENMYQSDAAHQSGEVPAFHAPAARWATEFIYRAIQCNFLRHLKLDEVLDLLSDYDGDMTPEVIYSADLVLRQLPGLFRFTRHLAPDDVMVPRLGAIAAAWPLSSVGVPVPGVPDAAMVMEHPALRMLYIDRIIENRDIARCGDPFVRSAVQAAIGGHEDAYWPGFSLQF